MGQTRVGDVWRKRQQCRSFQRLLSKRFGRTLPIIYLLVALDSAHLIAAVQTNTVLSVQRDSSIEALIVALESDEINQWSRATTFLGMRGKDALPALPALIRAIDRPRVRYSALNTLKDLGPVAEPAIPALIKAITAYPDDPSSSWESSQALTRIGAAAVPALKQAAQSTDPQLRIWACAALVKSEGTNSPSLRHLADTLPQSLRAIEMIGPLAGPIVPQIKEAMKRSNSREFVYALATIGPAAEPAMPEVLKALETKDPLGKIDAIRAIRAINAASAKDAVPLLVEALGANNTADAFPAGQQPRIREEAAETLGKIGVAARPAIPALIQALEDSEERVLAKPVTAIKRIDPTNPQALPALILAAHDSSSRVRTSANGALLRAGPVNIEIIRAFIALVRTNAERFHGAGFYNGPSGDIVPTCEAFFHRLGPEQQYAVIDLSGLAKDPRPSVQRIAFVGLSGIGDVPEEFLPALVRELQSPDGYWAETPLEKMGPKAKAAVPQLIAMLEDHRLRDASARILASIGTPGASSAIPVFESLIKNETDMEITLWQALLKLDPHSKAAIEGLEKFVTRPQKGQFDTFQILEAHGLLIQSSHDVESHARYLLSRTKDPEERIGACAVKILLEAHPQNEIRTLGLDRAFQLIETAKDGWSIEVVAQGLFDMGPDDTAYVPHLLRAIGRTRHDGRVQALKSFIVALGQIGPGAREALPELKSLTHYRIQQVHEIDEISDSLEFAAGTIRKSAEEAIRKIEKQ